MNRRVWLRPYLFEIVTVLNFLLFAAVSNRLVITSLAATFSSFIPTLFGYAAAGVAIRAVIAWRRGELAAFVRILRSNGWLSDTIRLIVFGSLMIHTYFWIKLLVPLFHPRLFDQELWNVDQKMMFGLSPNILFLNIFSQPVVMQVLDWSYARIFYASMSIAFIFFLSSPSRRLRVAFSNGNTLLWLWGAWLYMLVPSLGPAFRFPDVWLPFAYGLDMTQYFQAMLMRNYRSVQALPYGGSVAKVQLMLGIAAFPSLHVAFQTFAFLWMRRLWIYGEIVFGVFALVILIGSVVTGWHYLVDGLAGMVMAVVCYLLAASLARFGEWLRVRKAIHSAAV